MFSLLSAARRAPQLGPTFSQLAPVALRTVSTAGTPTPSRIEQQAIEKSEHLLGQAKAPEMGSRLWRILFELGVLNKRVSIFNPFRDSSQAGIKFYNQQNISEIAQVIESNIRAGQGSSGVEIGSFIMLPRPEATDGLPLKMAYIEPWVAHVVSQVLDGNRELGLLLQNTPLSAVVGPNKRDPGTHFERLNLVNRQLMRVGSFMWPNLILAACERYSEKNIGLSISKALQNYIDGLRQFRTFESPGRPHRLGTVRVYISGYAGVSSHEDNTPMTAYIADQMRTAYPDLKKVFCVGDTKGHSTSFDAIRLAKEFNDAGIRPNEVEVHLHAKEHNPSNPDEAREAGRNLLEVLTTFLSLGYFNIHASMGGSGYNPLTQKGQNIEAGNLSIPLLLCASTYLSSDNLVDPKIRHHDLARSLVIADHEQRVLYGHDGEDLYVNPMLDRLDFTMFDAAVQGAHSALTHAGKLTPKSPIDHRFGYEPI